MKKIRLIITSIIVLSGATAMFSGAGDIYTVKKIRGWTVQVHNQLLNSEKDLGGKVLDLLDAKLMDINRVVSPKALEQLHKVLIWVDVDNENFPCAVYHPSPKWLSEHGMDPRKARSVHISNAKNFLKWTIEQPSMVLHELAHAYHHQVLGYDNPLIKQAFKKAVDGGLYKSVMRYNGEMQRAYALNNDQEYFAELSEAFFGVNDFYPFVKAEVMQHDPDMYKILPELWGA